MFRRTLVFLILVLLFGQFSAGQQLHLQIIGQSEAESAVIDSLGYGKSFDDYISLQREIDSTQLRLQRLGFIENEVLETKKINDSSYLSNFSLQRRFYTIYIYTSKKDNLAPILKNLLEESNEDYFVTSIASTETILNVLTNEIIKNGQPFANLKLINLKKKDEKNLQADLEITYDKKRFINAIVLKGYEKFPKSYLKHFLKIKTNDVFNLEAIEQQTASLSNLPFANQVRSPEVLFTKDSTSLYLYLEKVKRNTFDGFLGFGTNEETNKLEFDGYLDLQLVNNLNYGEAIRLNYKSDEIDQKTFNVQVSAPYLFNSPLGVELNLNIFKKDSTFTTVSQAADIFYQINKSQRLFIGVKSFQSNDLLDQLNTNIDDYNTTMYTIKYNYLKTQNNSLLFPINFSVDGAFGIGDRKQGGETLSQQSFFFNAAKIFNLNEKNSIYINGLTSGLLSDNYFDNELLRFGGIRSIRGFEENSLEATLFGVLNTEYRYQLNNAIYVHSIFDAAYLENDISMVDQKLFGVGFGFGILTKAGLLRFNYASGKFEGQKFKISDSKIHLSLNALF